MKNLKIKSVVLAAALAVGLGVTGVAATTQAAEWGVLLEADCDEPEDKWDYQFTAVSYDTRDNNRFTHTKYTMEIYRCSVCGYIINGEEVIEEEPHDLVFSSTGNRWECTCCDYWE